MLLDYFSYLKNKTSQKTHNIHYVSHIHALVAEAAGKTPAAHQEGQEGHPHKHTSATAESFGVH